MNINQVSPFTKIVVPASMQDKEGTFHLMDTIISSFVRESYEQDENGKLNRIYVDDEKEIIKGHLEARYVEMYVPHEAAYILVNIDVENLKKILHTINQLESIEIQDTVKEFNERLS